MEHVQITVETQGEVSLIKLGGKIIGDAVPEFEATLRDQMAEVGLQLILDMQAVELLDSTGLGVLVGCYTSLRRRGGGIMLTYVPPHIKEILQLTRLNAVFDLYESNKEALDALKGS